MQPHFIMSIKNPQDEIIYTKQPTKITNVVNSKVSNTLNEMLKEVVSKGGGKNASILGYDIGGKTGTAQKYENGMIAKGKYVASFIGYYPTDNPEYAVLVVIDEPKGAYYGGVVAAPIAKDIFQAIFDVCEKPKDENLKEEDKINQANIKLPNFLGKTLTESIRILSSLGLQYLTSGDGVYVKDQIAAPGAMVSEGDIVLLMF